jgi:DeoR/GlpR family transcriptional regulator of sugar metabolism
VDGHERALAIIDRLRTAKRVGVTELAELTGCSEMTIRRDLDHLAERGVLRRVRGGAMSLLLRGEETPFPVREHEFVDAKDRIAAKVERLIADGESLILDSGTTTLALAHLLTHRRVTVIPLDLHSANALSNAPEVTLLIPGGQTRRAALSFTGPLTENSLLGLRVDTALLGCCGLSPQHGLTAHDIAEVPIKQAAIAVAQRRIAVCDGSKFSRTGLGRVGPITDLDMVVTDDTAPTEAITQLKEAGVAVQVV